jgi:hypothetical protein
MAARTDKAGIQDSPHVSSSLSTQTLILTRRQERMEPGNVSKRLRDAKHHVGRSRAEVVRLPTSRETTELTSCSCIVDFEDYTEPDIEDTEVHWNAVNPYRAWGLAESCSPGGKVEPYRQWRLDEGCSPDHVW